MPLNLPTEVWILFAAAGAFFLAPIVLVYLAYRFLR
jgi:hypothetical protein